MKRNVNIHGKPQKATFLDTGKTPALSQASDSGHREKAKSKKDVPKPYSIAEIILFDNIFDED